MARRSTRHSPMRAPAAGLALVALALLALPSLLPGCGGKITSGSSSVGQALGLAGAPLQLGVLTNSCGSNQEQDFFEVTNNGSAPVKLSDISFKYWIDDTSGQTVVPNIYNGGCVTGVGGNPSCVHQVSGVTASATQFSPACGPDPSHQANWEITITNTDTTSLPAGAIWSNVQSALHLASYGNFSPGTADWFSPCLTGSSYAADPHFAVYFQGNLVFSNGINAPSCRGPHGSQQLAGYYGPPPSPSVAPLAGPVPPATQLALDVGLSVQNPQGLQTFIQQVSDPNSPSYRQYLTTAQFQQQYGASSTAYQSVIAWAQSQGLTVTNTVPSNLLVTVFGTAAQFEQALYTNLVFRLRADGSQFITVDRDPSLDLATPILRITGLDDFVVPQPAFALPPPPAVNSTGTGNWSGLYLSADIRNAYLGQGTSCSTLLGDGQTIGLLELESFKTSDVQSYDSLQNPAINPNNVVLSALIAGPLFTPGPPNDAEAALDVQMAQAMAPNAAVHVYQGTTGITGHADSLLHAIANDSAVTVASNSWNFGRDDNSEQAIDQMAAEGISYFTASGDFGNIGDPQDDRDMANQTLVGGTQLSTNVLGSAPNVYPNPYYASEDIWSGGGFKSTTGGGIMDGNGGFCWPWPFCDPSPTGIPGYQSQVPMNTNGGSTSFRNFPDVALLASNVAIVFNGSQTGSGGTSAAAPLWAGFAALSNEASAAAGVGRLGFANPVIYDIGLTRGTTVDLYAKSFHDIADGFFNGAAEFPSVAGYDLTTGWGTPTCGLIQQLATTTPLTAYPELELVIGTGGDDARQDSSISAQIFLADNVTLLQTVNVKSQGDNSWGNGSVHQIIVPLAQPVAADGLGNIIVTLTSHNGLIETDDNWNIESLQARLVAPRSPEQCVTTVTGDPVARLTGSAPSQTFPAGVGCSTPVNPPPANPNMELIISTGGDDLRQDSELQCTVFYVNQPSPQGPIELKQSGDAAWANNTVKDLTFSLTQSGPIDHITLSLIEHDALIETDDNWNINGINILTSIPGGPETCQIDLNGDPEVRLTGSAGSVAYVPVSGCP